MFKVERLGGSYTDNGNDGKLTKKTEERRYGRKTEKKEATMKAKKNLKNREDLKKSREEETKLSGVSLI